MKHKESSLFLLLAKNYLLFTVTLLVITGGVYLLRDSYIDSLYEPDDWNLLLQDANLEKENYKELRKYVHNKGSGFAILDASGNMLFSSKAKWDLNLTDDEISYVWEFDADSFIETFYDYEEDGKIRYLVVESENDENERARMISGMVLDENYHVVSGGMHGDKRQYTKREFEILSGRYPWEKDLYRYGFCNTKGEERILLLLMAYTPDTDFYRLYDESWRIWLLFIPLYIIAAGLFIWGMSQKIRKPLKLLHTAVEAQQEGRFVPVGNCGGPQEIQRIGKSFDMLSERLEESEKERRRLDEGRQKMLADISHDLKTPVTVIAGYINALYDGKVPKGQEKNYLAVIRSRTEALTELIHAFHEFSKVEHPRFSLELKRVEICEYLRGYLAGKYDEIALAGFSLEILIPEEEVYCKLDEVQFRRVLDNLLSNSLRHNRLGTVLFVELAVEEDSVAVIVADNGQGIPKERREVIFEPFVVGSEARSGGRSGLGLAIVRRIVGLHGGTVELAEHPEEGRNVEFVVKLFRFM